MDEQRLQQMVNSLSGFDGSENEVIYDGSIDPGLEFGGGMMSFADEGSKDKFFTLTITNTGTAASDKLIALFPGYFSAASDIKNLAGTSVAGILTEGTVVTETNANVMAVGEGKSIKNFIEYIRYNPTRLIGIKMYTDSPTQFDQSLLIRKLTPWIEGESKNYIPSNYKDSKQTDTTRVEIPLNDFQLDVNTVLITTIKAARTVSYTFYAGASRSVAAELRNKAAIARATMRRAYGD